MATRGLRGPRPRPLPRRRRAQADRWGQPSAVSPHSERPGGSPRRLHAQAVLLPSKRLRVSFHSLPPAHAPRPAAAPAPPERVVIPGVRAPRSYAFPLMPRRSLLSAMAVPLVLFATASAQAATAPVAAPVLTSAVFASPVGIQWAPSPDLFNVTQSVLRAPGPCTSPPSGGQYRMTFGDNTTSSYSDPAPDGTYCYYIQAADLVAAAYSPGLTVVVDTLPPVATVAVSGQSAAGVVSGTVGVSGTAADAGAGVAASVLRVGPTGACA